MHQRWAWLTSLAALACAPARVGDTAHTPTCGAPPVMELSAGTLDFGDIELGVPARGSFEVHNVVVADAGAAALGIDRLQGMVFDLGTATGGDVSWDASELACAGGQAKSHRDSTHDAEPSPDTGLLPRETSGVARIPLGEPAPGLEIQEGAVLQNRGADVLTLDDVSLDGSCPPKFTLVSAPAPGCTLAQFETTPVELSFVGSSTEPRACVVWISSDDPEAPRAGLYLAAFAPTDVGSADGQDWAKARFTSWAAGGATWDVVRRVRYPCPSEFATS